MSLDHLLYLPSHFPNLQLVQHLNIEYLVKLEAHILQPSPYFQGEFISLSSKSVEIEDNKIRTKEGIVTACA